MQIQLTQNSPEWLEFRSTRIGASDVPIIMGKSPYKTALELWREKKGEIQPKNSQIRSRNLIAIKNKSRK